MPISTTRTFIETRDSIITAALRKINGVPVGQVPTVNQINEAALALNNMVLGLQNEGIMLWSVQEQYITLTDAVATYNTDPAVLGIFNPYIRQNNIDTPLEHIVYEHYQAITNKTEVGIPVKIYFNESFELPAVTVWRVPDISLAGIRIYYSAYLRLRDFTISSNNPDFPVTWNEALIYGLAWRLAPEYVRPKEEQDKLFKYAEYFKQLAWGGSRESTGTITIAPRR